MAAARPGPAILVTRVIFVILVGYGGVLLGESVDVNVPGVVWGAAGVLAGIAVIALERAAHAISMPRLFVGALGAIGGVLFAQLLASALIVVVPAVDSRRTAW